MSEHQNKNPEKPKPPVTPELQRAFRGVYGQLMQLNSKGADPVVISRREGSNLYTHKADIAEFNGEAFEPNATHRPLRLVDENGEAHISHSIVADEKAASDYGLLARIEIMEPAGGSHPADVYLLYPDQSIEHVRRTSENDGFDDEGDDINWREVNVNIGWLDANQMDDLQQLLESASQSS